MHPPSLPSEVQAAIANDRLRLLSVAFYISGAIGAVFVSFLLLHLVLFTGVSFIPESMWSTGKSAHQEAPPVIVFRIIAIVIFFIIISGWALGGLTAYAGRCIARRENRIFVLIMAGVNCIWIPYGTLLGIATFMLLTTPSAKHAFQTEQDAAANP
jgi:hypothetical protein